MYGFWLKMVWVMGYGRVMGFGANISGNEHGGPEKVWVITESTVHINFILNLGLWDLQLLTL